MHFALLFWFHLHFFPTTVLPYSNFLYVCVYVSIVACQPYQASQTNSQLAKPSSSRLAFVVRRTRALKNLSHSVTVRNIGFSQIYSVLSYVCMYILVYTYMHRFVTRNVSEFVTGLFVLIHCCWDFLCDFCIIVEVIGVPASRAKVHFACLYVCKYTHARIHV